MKPPYSVHCARSSARHKYHLIRPESGKSYCGCGTVHWSRNAYIQEFRMHTQSHELTFPQICGRCLQIHLQGTGNRLAVRRDSGHPILIEMVGEYVNEVVERTTIEPSLKSKKRIGDYMNPSLCKSKGEPK